MVSSKKPTELLHKFKQELDRIHTPEELGSLANIVLEALFGLTRTDIVVDSPMDISRLDQEKFKNTIARLKENEPIQYILGTTEFYGRQFKVNKHVLIPRPETEELVDLIVKRSKGDVHIVDIGTGSGCIPISLKLALPESKVMGLDISAEALGVARENAQLLRAEVNFFQTNILTENLDGEFDAIISNPPYVRKSEQHHMKDNVLKYEPHLALFVEDEDPLLFYKRIVAFSQTHLKRGGHLYFEINEALGASVVELMEGRGLKDVTLKKDFSGRDRMVYGMK